jgi:AcrR family transcriptional regulator
MNNETVKEPKQQRSIEKRDKILKYGFDLLCKKGYYNTNTAEIAKAADVSTGIVYRYFPNKKSILLEGFSTFYVSYFNNIFNKLFEIKRIEDLRMYIEEILDFAIKFHGVTLSVHSNFELLALSDPEVAAYFDKMEESMTENIVSALPNIGLDIQHPHEKIHLCFHVITNYIHSYCYKKQVFIDYSYYRKLALDAVMKILTSDD